MKPKYLIIGCSGIFLMVFSLLLFVALLFSDEQDSGFSDIQSGGINVSDEVVAHKPMVEKYAKEYGVEEYVHVLLAIIQVESGGTAEDVMQSSESLGFPPNTLGTEGSIKQGVKYFASLLQTAEKNGSDLNAVIQSYNYGGGFLGYITDRGNKYTFELAESFANQNSNGEKVSYPNPIAIPINGGWRYNYGNMFYVQLASQYLVTTQFDDDTVQAIMDEALKYEGWKYVYGGASPTTSFDCSGLTQWSYGKAGINLPRTAQEQYDVTQHILLSEAESGDLIFFHSTYNAGSYITHVGIYLGNNQMFHAGDPIGYADLTSSYWQQHLVGAGRIKK
ncbi:lysozyme family protein [Enterococcus faecium]|uniref:bifunctional lytic transglycosylase/C40 family peptidase n=1 Tax=Enterococcus faecium TaxID=1352 RepID=UPI00111DBD5C|nr:bifunctional lysozyme/C40 family peptidase [Enterococcus faecium]TNX50217.1 peptidase P60 [Enterococcus faecium]